MVKQPPKRNFYHGKIVLLRNGLNEFERIEIVVIKITSTVDTTRGVGITESSWLGEGGRFVVAGEEAAC